jgi:hypothetical protein
VVAGPRHAPRVQGLGPRGRHMGRAYPYPYSYPYPVPVPLPLSLTPTPTLTRLGSQDGMAPHSTGVVPDPGMTTDFWYTLGRPNPNSKCDSGTRLGGLAPASLLPSLPPSRSLPTARAGRIATKCVERVCWRLPCCGYMHFTPGRPWPAPPPPMRNDDAMFIAVVVNTTHPNVTRRIEAARPAPPPALPPALRLGWAGQEMLLTLTLTLIGWPGQEMLVGLKVSTVNTTHPNSMATHFRHVATEVPPWTLASPGPCLGW